MNIYEESREKLEELRDWLKDNPQKRNEDTTRFHLIDRLLLDCLAWNPEDITTEDSHGKEYSDYTLHLLRPTAILEAKKEGNYFELPLGKTRVIYPIKTIRKDNPEVGKALEQVSGYCQKRGIEIGIVSNGWQLIIFIANRTDSTPPLEGSCFVFSSIDVMLENFKELWNALSKFGLEGIYVRKQLLGDTLPELPMKASATLKNYPGIKNRNPFQTDLQIISELVLEDIVKERDVEKEFLKECYSKSGALSQYALVSKEILSSRYKYLFEDGNTPVNLEAVISKKGISDDLKEIIASSLSRRPILLVGDVGVGKTSFINNLIKVEAEEVFDNAYTFVIDLGSKAVITQDIRKTIVDDITNQISELYNVDIFEDGFVRGTYNLELKKFKHGIYKKLFELNDNKALIKEIEFLEEKIEDKASHLEKSLEHLSKGRKKQVIIFLDNCDQRDDDSQQMAFLISQEIAQNWSATAFVTLRPETFHRSLKSGALSGYHPKAFTIAPPRVSEVINKRLDFAQKITKGQVPIKNLQMSMTFSRLDDFIEVIKMSFYYNSDLNEFIDNISNGNIRQAIDILKAFIGSGHVDTEKILDIYQKSGKYYVPLHEFLRAIMYGDTRYYDPQTSRIVNIYDVHFHDGKEHFIMPITLGILYHNMTSGKNEGFLQISSIFEHLQSIGFTPQQIDVTINILYAKGMVETSQKGNNLDREDFPSLLRITTLGVYHFTNLPNFFVYYDAISVDTPIFDKSIRDLITGTEKIKERLERSKLFISYLKKQWQYFNGKQTFFDFDKCYLQVEKGIEEISLRVNSAKKETDI